MSAFHAARMNPDLAKRVILTSSVFLGSKNGPGLSRVRFEELKSSLLWVHHADDPCRFTPYREAQAFAKKSGAPLVIAKGQDLIALKIRQIAEENGVPVVEDKLLARSLYESVEVDKVIPPEFYKAVAEIILFLMARGSSGTPAVTKG